LRGYRPDKISERASTSGELVATERRRSSASSPSSPPNNGLGFSSPAQHDHGGRLDAPRPDDDSTADPWRVGRLVKARSRRKRRRWPRSLRNCHAPLSHRHRPQPVIEEIIGPRPLGRGLPTRRADGPRGEDGDQPLRRTRCGHPLAAGRHIRGHALNGREKPGFALSALSPAKSTTHARTNCRIEGRPRSWSASAAQRIATGPPVTDTPTDAAADYAGSSVHRRGEVNDHGDSLTATLWKSVRPLIEEDRRSPAQVKLLILRGITVGGHRFGQNGSKSRRPRASPSSAT